MIDPISITAIIGAVTALAIAFLSRVKHSSCCGIDVETRRLERKKLLENED